MLAGFPTDLEFFTALLEDMPDRVSVVSTAGQFIYLNRACAQMFEDMLGLPRERVIGIYGQDLPVPERLRQDMNARLTRALAGDLARFEILVPQPGGSRWIEFEPFPLRRADGSLAGTAMISRDIHQRKSAELRLQLLSKISALAESPGYDELLSAVAQLSIPELADCCLVDRIESGQHRPLAAAHRDPGKVGLLTALPRLQVRVALFQAPEVESLRRGQTILVEEVTEETLRRYKMSPQEQEAVRALQVGSMMIVPQLVLGTLVGVTIFMTTADSGRRYGPQDVALAEDLSRRVGYLLALAEELMFRERMMGILGHDLRNPLSAVRGLTGLLLVDATLPAPLRRLATHMDSAARRMVELIDTLLDFTRSRYHGSMPIEPAPADLHEVCRGVLGELRAAHPGRVIEARHEGDGAGEWDAARMAQVIVNLVTNALQHGAAEAPVRVLVSAAERELVLQIENRGPAIPDELRSRLFEPFRSGARSDQGARQRGLGLGLYIARQIVSAHGGRIEVASSDAVGTTFTVRLPRRRG